MAFESLPNVKIENTYLVQCLASLAFASQGY